MAVTVIPNRETLAGELSAISIGRRVKTAMMTALMGLAVVLVGFVLVLVLVTVATKGWSIVTGQCPKWCTKDIIPSPRRPGPGMGRFASALRFLTNVMAGVPSIVMGLFIYVFWVVPRGTHGLTGLSGAFALACLMLPIVVRSAEEMLRLVPQSLRDASYALGGSDSRTTLTVVLPKAAPGIISGVLLAIARAAGETAPLLFTIGALKQSNWNPFKGTNTALSMQIYSNAKESFAAAQERAWGAALTLIALAFLFTLIARVVTATLSRNR